MEDLTEENLKSTLITFLKSQLEGRARKTLPENVTTVEDIKMALKTKLKPDSSKIIVGKLSALSIKNNDYADFAKQAEDLADALKRSLIMEGITKNKAHEMTIQHTVS
ncbi:hypothetical protein EVAR_73584_1, partial [Eumeta japonica]